MERLNDGLKDKLKRKLKELFQFETQDLDFGIYRIMNYKRREVERFIDEELIEEIKKQLSLLSEEEKKRLKEKIRELENRNGVKAYLEALRRNDEERVKIFRETFAEQIGEYEKLKQQLDQIKISEDVEREIYNHLINFFSRYYDNGDFISKPRVGKKEKYAVPYSGEEVLLYWANKDQYYIKTTEYFRKYTFKVKGLTVNFRVVEAEEEKGNVKATEKKLFVLNERIYDFDEEKNELNIYFEYRTLTDEEKERYKHGNTVSQDKANEETIKVLEERIRENSPARLIFEKEGEKTLIEKHLYRYTRRNTTDYFIHKDLKGFLEREIDFYIKNELLRLEDLQVLEESGYFDKLKLYLTGARVFRNIALKIIEFLAQIENFQKKIWEKKNFVIQTDYVITLGKIKEYAGEKFLESILDEILSNEKQLEEWKELFGIKVKDKKDLIENNTLQGKEWKKLPFDTKHFDEDFKWKLLVALSEENDLDDILDGVLIKSENWQAVNLLLNKYREKIKAIYIDPPYNTGNDEFLYKDNYQHSSWLTMMENRLRLAKQILNEKGYFYCSIDWNESHLLKKLLDFVFGEDKFQREIIWNTGENISGFKSRAPNWIRQHDTIYFYTKTKEGRILNKLWTPINLEDFKWKPQTKLDILGDDKNNLYIEKWINGKLTKIRIENKEVKAIGDVWNDIYSFQYSFAAADEGLAFPTQKPQDLLRRIVQASTRERDIILDFFAGSGTTAVVAQKLWRKYICIEMANCFEEILLPRMKKVLFGEKSGTSKKVNWQGGGFFKYHTLEQYEDALENVEFEEPQKELYEFSDYFVKYMLEWETKNSRTLLNIDELKDPFNYKLKIIENYQQKVVNVDLVETFNYLLGLHVKGYRVLEDNGRKYVFVFGEKDGKRTVVAWRNIKDIGFEEDKEIIERQIKEFSPSEIYVNGDCAVKGFKPIEPEFKALMFQKVE